jgi:uncharacterized protein (DUF433 family)
MPELTSAKRALCDPGSVSDRPRSGGVPTYLDAPVLALPEAARQLGMPATTLRHWLEGHTIDGRFYEPVLRSEPTGSNDLAWGEMVEADYLRAYRGKGVSMQSLRPFIQQARERFGLRYPLAHLRPFTDGRRLLLELQTEAHLSEALRVVYELHDGQLELDHRADSWLERVERGADRDIAARIRPDGPGSPVVHDPQISSAAATVAGVRTEIIREQYESGEETREIAQTFGLPIDYVLAALSHEQRQRPLRVAA